MESGQGWDSDNDGQVSASGVKKNTSENSLFTNKRKGLASCMIPTQLLAPIIPEEDPEVDEYYHVESPGDSSN
eukprot:893615-Pyramimonas_sp.AAC.1